MTHWSLDVAKKFVPGTVITLVLMILSMLFLDQPVALYVYHSDPIRTVIHTLLTTLTGSTNSNNEIPDFLTPMTLVITIVSWAGYWIRVHRGHFDRHTYFFKMVGTTVPFAFLAKSITKFVFGRIDTRVWVIDPTQSRNFHWFDGVGSYHGFPSGHMAVLTPLLIALWHLYPRLKPLWGAALGGMAIALVLTDYHFVSDVIAGTYLGLLIYCLCLKWQVPNSLACGDAIWSKRSFSRKESNEL
jgi:membrane-associated phospholipid phosphatase